MRVSLLGSVLMVAAIAACSDAADQGGGTEPPASQGTPPAATAGNTGGTPQTGGGNTGQGGTPEEDAAAPSVHADAGQDASAGQGASDASDPFGSAQVCTSNQHWTNGNNGSDLMHPGAACIACHKQTGGPTFVIAGTVFPTAHEPTDCNGESAVTVNITDAKGKTATITTTGAGNFHSATSLTAPFKVSLTSNGRTRAMSNSAPNGDCNGCHTQAGANGAPGRIVAP